MKMKLLCIIGLLALLTSGDVTTAVKTYGSYTHFPKPILVNATATPNTESANISVSLEFTAYTHETLFLMITNNSGHSIEYGDGYEITGNQWGNAGAIDTNFYGLPPGERREIQISIKGLDHGEFRVTKDIITDPENPSAEPYEVIAEFALENTAIPPDVNGAMLDVDPDFAAPVGAVIYITNGFGSGRIYFDKSYWLQRYTGAGWQDIQIIGSDGFPNEKYSLAPRQLLNLTEYWAWLYGSLPPGEYRIGKSVLHRADDGEDTQYDMYAIFTLDGEPISEFVQKDGGDWAHPFSGITTFRAEVVKLLAPDYSRVLSGSESLVNSLTPILEGWKTGEQCIIGDNMTITVLNSNNEQISFSDIPLGATVDITFDGFVFTSLPGIIDDALLIKIIG